MNKIILLESPPDIEMYLDNLQLNIGSLFKGVKNIPKGAHYLSYKSNQGKSGHFLYILRSGIARRWDSSVEEFIPVESAEDLLENEELESLLVDYPMDSYKLWCASTRYIDENIVARIEGPESLEYTIVPKRKISKEMSPEEITRCNFDKSYILYDLIQQQFSSFNEFLGEFQFAFISFILGESQESLNQWKDCLIVLCNAEKALTEIPEFFERFIPVLYTQLGSISKDVFFDPILGQSFIPTCLSSLISLLDDPELSPSLYDKGRRLTKYISKRFGVTEALMGNEDAPVIVN